MSKNKNASNASLLGPGSAVTDLFASQGVRLGLSWDARIRNSSFEDAVGKLLDYECSSLEGHDRIVDNWLRLRTMRDFIKNHG